MPRTKNSKPMPMVEKVKVSSDGTSKESVFSMIVGTVLVALGLLLFVSGVVALVLFNLPPKQDLTVNKPTLYEIPATTNARNVKIKGETEYSKAMIWINDEVFAKTISVKDGRFEIEYPVSTEGIYKIEAAAITGFPIRKRSEKTLVNVVVDWSAPSKDVKFTYDKSVDTKTFSMSGTIEPNTTVVLEKNGKEYSTTSNEFGKFKMSKIPLTEGKNSFKVTLKDMAGNVTRLDSNVNVTYLAGNINGNGASTNLPESAGEMSNMLSYVLGNKLMAIFGFVALGLFGANLYFVSRKLRRSVAA